MVPKKFQKTAVSINSRTEVIVIDSKFITKAVKSQVLFEGLLPYIEHVVNCYHKSHDAVDEAGVVDKLKYIKDFLDMVVNTCDDPTEKDM